MVVEGSAVRCIMRLKDSRASCSTRGGWRAGVGGDRLEGGGINRKRASLKEGGKRFEIECVTGSKPKFKR